MCNKAVEAKELNVRNSRSVYLITYSQADLNKFPSRESFQEAVCDAFEHQGSHTGDTDSNTLVSRWVCSKENTKKLAGTITWLSSWQG